MAAQHSGRQAIQHELRERGGVDVLLVVTSLLEKCVASSLAAGSLAGMVLMCVAARPPRARPLAAPCR